MSLIVKEFKGYQNANYLTFVENEGDENLFITSSKIYLPDVKLGTGPTVTFEMPRSLDESLFMKINSLENELSKTLKNLNPNIETNLSFECQKVLTSDSNNLLNNIRSNYYGFQGDPKMFLKGNWRSIKLVNFKDEVIARDVLKQGNYQFVVRANMAYLGPHKNPNHIASLQLRISEIRFEPLKFKKSSTKQKRKASNCEADEPQAKKVYISDDDVKTEC